MKLNSTKRGVSLHMSLLEWTQFKLLMANVWNNFDVSMYPSMYHCLSDLSEIPDIKRAIFMWSDDDEPMMNGENEWEKAMYLVNACIATLNCGCSVLEYDELYVDSLHYRCREFERAYQDWINRKKKRRET